MIPARFANQLWHVAARPNHRRFRSALHHPRSVQASVLHRILRHNAATQFGRAHRFDKLPSPAAFREVVPLSDYDDYAPFLEKVVRGEPAILTRDPVTHFVPTSGSTSARKLIPWTAALQRDFNRAIDAWIGDLFSQSPGLKRGRAYWSVSPAAPEQQDPDSPIRIGLEDDTDYLGGIAGKVIRNVMAVPAAVRHVWDTDSFRYLVLLHLAAARDLSLVSVWHPTFFTLLLDSLPTHFESILRSLRNGLIDPPTPLAPRLHGRFQAAFRPDPARARELEQLDPTRPGTLWPRLQLLSAWGDHETPERNDLTSRFPQARFQPKGLLATEGVVTIPFAGHTPLAITSHFFEFLDQDDRLCLAHQLRRGQHYEVVVTTSGGLYRYRLRDQVEVVGFLHRTPCLRFAGRAGGVSDLRGEKIDPQFVGTVLERLTAAFTHPIRFQLLAADADTDPPGYLFVCVSESAPDLDRLSSQLEEFLCDNPHYRLCRFLGQLRPVGARMVAPSAIEAYTAWRTARGQILGNLKPVLIDSGPGLLACFPPRPPTVYSPPHSV